MKNIRSKYRQAIDSGKKSGHGRVVKLFFELCEHIWGGSPATKTIINGMESVDLTREIHDYSTEPSESRESDNDSSPEDSVAQPAASVIDKRRSFLDSKLKGYKQEKLKRKLSVESQLLHIAQDEIQIKKKLIEKIESMDKMHAIHMKKLQVNMQQLTGSIADGFSMLRQIMNQPNQHPQMSHYMPPALNYSNGFINPAFQVSQCNAALQSQTGKTGVSCTQEPYLDGSSSSDMFSS